MEVVGQAKKDDMVLCIMLCISCFILMDIITAILEDRYFAYSIVFSILCFFRIYLHKNRYIRQPETERLENGKLVAQALITLFSILAIILSATPITCSIGELLYHTLPRMIWNIIDLKFLCLTLAFIFHNGLHYLLFERESSLVKIIKNLIFIFESGLTLTVIFSATFLGPGPLALLLGVIFQTIFSISLYNILFIIIWTLLFLLLFWFSSLLVIDFYPISMTKVLSKIQRLF